MYFFGVGLVCGDHLFCRLGLHVRKQEIYLISWTPREIVTVLRSDGMRLALYRGPPFCNIKFYVKREDTHILLKLFFIPDVFCISEKLNKLCHIYVQH